MNSLGHQQAQLANRRRSSVRASLTIPGLAPLHARQARQNAGQVRPSILLPLALLPVGDPNPILGVRRLSTGCSRQLGQCLDSAHALRICTFSQRRRILCGATARSTMWRIATVPRPGSRLSRFGSTRRPESFVQDPRVLLHIPSERTQARAEMSARSRDQSVASIAHRVACQKAAAPHRTERSTPR